MPERLGVIRETRPHIADGLTNFATRVRKYWIVTTAFGFIVAVLDVIALAILPVRRPLDLAVLRRAVDRRQPVLLRGRQVELRVLNTQGPVIRVRTNSSSGMPDARSTTQPRMSVL